MCAGRSARASVADGPPAPTDPHDAVVIEHRHAVGGQPDVALQTGRAEAEAQREGLEVFSGAWARAPRWANAIGLLEQRREPLLHNVR